MFKFLRPAKPGASKAKPAAPKPAAKALADRPTPKVHPPGTVAPLSAPKVEPKRYAERPMTPERAALIKNALAVHKSQQTIFAELNDEARQKLILMAMLMLLKEARGEK